MGKRLQGKVALITGASFGIGEATALRLAEEGALVLAVARGAERLAAVVERIRAAGGRAEVCAADITDAGEVEALVNRVKQSHGRLDILVNCAGVKILASVDNARVEDWQRMFSVNLLGLMQLTKAVLPIMRAQHGGHVVNMSSLAGRVSMGNGSAYSVTKFGVNAFSDALRKETFKDRVRVTMVEPGPVATEADKDPAIRAKRQAMLGDIEPLSTDDIAGAICYAVCQPPRVNVNEILLTPTDYVR